MHFDSNTISNISVVFVFLIDNQFIQSFQLLLVYEEFVRSTFEQSSLTPGQEGLPFVLIQIMIVLSSFSSHFQDSISLLIDTPFYKTPAWRDQIDTLVCDINELNAIAITLGFPVCFDMSDQLQEHCEKEEMLSCIPPCKAETVPPFSFLHKLNPLFDDCIPSSVDSDNHNDVQKLSQILALQKEFCDYCKNSIEVCQRKQQVILHAITLLNIPSLV